MKLEHYSGLISVELIKDSFNPQFNSRITTMVLEYPRLVHCFDEQTEVLARIGNSAPEFMSFKKAAVLGANVGQYDKDTGRVSFVSPIESVENSGTHKMVRFEKSKLSLSVTDKHRMLVDKRTTGNEFVPEVWLADEFLGDYKMCRIRQSGSFEENQTMSKEEIALSIWYASDGHKPKVGDKVQFHLRKKRKVDAIISLLSSLGIEYEASNYDTDFVIKFNKPYWVDDCYTEDGQKKIPDMAMFMDNETYAFCKQAILESDGSVANNDFNSTSVKFAEQVQILAHLHNEAMNLCSYGKDGYNRLYKSKFKETSYISLRKDKDEFYEEELNGTVYCVTVPSSFIMVRRKGVVFISGNCELMTHRVLTKNASSSRAIPVSKVIEQVQSNPAMPVRFGKNQAGMQDAGEYEQSDAVKSLWVESAKSACSFASVMNDMKAHKQVINRILEPYQFIRVCVTSTNWNNWFNLRNHPDADPTIHALAKVMYEVFCKSNPNVLQPGQWHVPFVNDVTDASSQKFYDEEGNELTLEQALKISSSCAAQTSYRKLDNSLDKAEDIYKKLIESKPCHASPVEHQAMAIPAVDNPMDYFKVKGVTHIDRNGIPWSGNFHGFVQNRQLIPDNAVYY